MEVMFLLAFTIHNIEEGIWLPAWSKYAGRYHPQVTKHEFRFALIVVTLAGYLLTFLFLIFGRSPELIKYLYLGFVLMMCLNSVFPHLIATIVIKRYAPGTITGLLLNLPIGMAIVLNHWKEGAQLGKMGIALIAVSAISIASLRPLFRLGGKLSTKLKGKGA